MKIEKELYKITLYDLWCHPIADGTEIFFTEDIEDFQKRWIKCGADKGRIERFLRSKSGELVTDWYSDDHDLNIVQKDICTIYDEKEFMLGNVYFGIKNAIGFDKWLHADKINFWFKWIRFKQDFLRIANVKVLGLTECFYDNEKKCIEYSLAECECNPIMQRLHSKKIFDIFLRSYNPSDFAENSYVSICYLFDRYFSSEKKLIKDTRKFLVTKRELNVLFKNFIGC